MPFCSCAHDYLLTPHCNVLVIVNSKFAKNENGDCLFCRLNPWWCQPFDRIAWDLLMQIIVQKCFWQCDTHCVLVEKIYALSCGAQVRWIPLKRCVFAFLELGTIRDVWSFDLRNTYLRNAHLRTSAILRYNLEHISLYWIPYSTVVAFVSSLGALASLFTLTQARRTTRSPILSESKNRLENPDGSTIELMTPASRAHTARLLPENH